MQIEVREVDTSDPALMDALALVRTDTIRCIDPDDPPASAAELATEIDATTTERHVRSWVAFADGEPAGEATFELEDAQENRHIVSSDWVAVRAPYRRHGVADAVLRVALDAFAADGRTTLMLWAPRLDPDVGARYAERLGLTSGSEERCSRLRMSELDEALVDRWLADGDARDDGYRLVTLGARCPDELLGPYLEATAAMGDMPTDDLEWVVTPTDEALARSREDVWAAKSLAVARTLALAPDGSGAGFSELFVSGHRPTLAWQGDTGVVPAHRGHGLGRWLKAANLRHAQALSPGFEVVETYNAQTNPWMLDINVAMGFRPHVIYRGYQGDLARARAVLA